MVRLMTDPIWTILYILNIILQHYRCIIGVCIMIWLQQSCDTLRIVLRSRVKQYNRLRLRSINRTNFHSRPQVYTAVPISMYIYTFMYVNCVYRQLRFGEFVGLNNRRITFITKMPNTCDRRRHACILYKIYYK